MSNDVPQELSYRRATNAAWVGLATSLALWLLAAAVSVWTGSQALNAAAWHLLGGALVWGSVWLIYQQHRLERAEALEAEELSADTETASMFAEGGQSLELAKRRLETLYRVGINVVSLTLAAFLLVAGGMLLYGAVRSIRRVPGEDADFTGLLELSLANPAAGGLPVLLVAAAMALVGFLIARYTAGMTRAPIWSLLRGGAAYLMGNVVVLVGIAIAAAIELTGNRWGYAVMTLAVPAVMIVLGLEVLFSLLLSVYRPQSARTAASGEVADGVPATPHPGERSRAAFDSRLLGWLTRPESLGRIVAETLDYQFGFDVSRSGVYTMARKALLPLLGLAAVIMLTLSSVVIVPPQQQAVVTQLGKLPEDAIRDPGISFKAPWPLASAERYDTSEIRSFSVGSIAEGKRTGQALLWTNTHVEGGERYLVSAAARGAASRSQRESRDAADASGGAEDRRAVAAGLVGGELVIHWRIRDLAAYLDPASPRRPQRLLEMIADEELTAYVAARDIDTLLTTARLDRDNTLREAIQQRVDGIGIEIVYAGLFGVHPPQDGDVAQAFLRVVTALLTQRTAVTEAETNRVGLLSAVAGSVEQARRIDRAITELEASEPGPEERDAAVANVQRLIDGAGGDAARVLAEARAERWRLALSEEGLSSSFAFDVSAFRRAPAYYRARRYLDTLAAAMPGVRKIVTAIQPAGDEPVFRLNLEDEQSGLDSFLGGE
ncbi:SPFH domain-containing protein [Phycisphaera mikurensis]|uniref:Hypothetical membrane protein n=1 Tax=Phycisphaera mikurensis (strain NBRC 102666 / KCTC 22515 / FYK2301M01) TaxID=1142394 RepID=I0IEN2_PHYMF|nr:SPFH domain-containing protein [Phycisphaera mikurensis]MBB6441518.1 regulator of protease activity HflC (stomatin/prohibitin superfamily) [Phycisphaera mikurensis]BAM03720.1 hypothetical membrane protein [Phycisphaera mikurensis NBRC 102666]